MLDLLTRSQVAITDFEFSTGQNVVFPIDTYVKTLSGIMTLSGINRCHGYQIQEFELIV